MPLAGLHRDRHRCHIRNRKGIEWTIVLVRRCATRRKSLQLSPIRRTGMGPIDATAILVRWGL